MQDVNVQIVLGALGVLAILILVLWWKGGFKLKVGNVVDVSGEAPPVQKDVTVGKELNAEEATIGRVTGVEGAPQGNVSVLEKANVKGGHIDSIVGVSAGTPPPEKPKSGGTE